MAEWTKQEYEVAMQQRDDLFPGYAEEEEDGEETAENMLNLLCQRNRMMAQMIQRIHCGTVRHFTRNEIAVALAWGFFAIVTIAGLLYFAHPWH